MKGCTYHKEFHHGCHLSSHHPGIIGSLGILGLHTFLPLYSNAIHILSLHHNLDRATSQSTEIKWSVLPVFKKLIFLLTTYYKCFIYCKNLVPLVESTEVLEWLGYRISSGTNHR